ncbi:heat shock protein 23-like [Lucilia cuprina]|uniref:heat shock protein 23-like n=1 Tax=Lucilia cuprina TaxID=7375 RepID=UPI001F06BBBB|nr:heat shock protein 23-like [Lucilia cuprina]
MRTLPILWRMAEDLRRLAMPSSPFFEYPFASTYRIAPWNHMNRLVQDELGKINKDGYQVSMNVSEFKPEELTVKVVDNHVIVEGKSEEQHDNSGYVSRYFVRRVALPTGYEADNAISTLTSDGVLTVSVPKPQIEEKAREIPIQRVDAASIKSKESMEEGAASKKDKN